ncbi:hypothetical protein [Bradyrhizobium sp. Ce-3]|nr:hypothetical protein [Bradyrhizobium sp. Ce-3]
MQTLRGDLDHVTVVENRPAAGGRARLLARQALQPIVEMIGSVD